MKKAVEERAVFEEEIPEVFINSKDTVAVGAGNKFKGHICGAFLTVFYPACRTKSGVAAERNELEIPAVGTCIHGSAERGISTVDHLRDVFHFNVSGMQSILDDFVIVFKNFL